MVEPDEFPIKFGPVSNGEFYPVPHSPVVRETIRRTHELADANARRLGMSRRRFLASTTGAAAAFFVLSACSKDEHESRGESPGGTFAVPEETTIDKDAALETLGGEEFIFDVQTHYVNYDLAVAGGEWTSVFPFASCAEGKAAGNSKACFTADAYFREMYVRSDTSMSILSALPTPNGLGLASEDMVYAIDVATQIGCDGRVLMHGGAYPHRGPIDAALAGMTDLRDHYDIVAWKIYTMVPTDSHFYFDDHDPSARRSANGSSTTCARSVRRSSARTRASRRSSARPPSSPIRATSVRPRPATRTSPSSSTTPASSPTWAARARTTRTTPHRRVSTGSSARCSRRKSNRTATCTPSSAGRGGSSCATRPWPRTFSGSC